MQHFSAPSLLRFIPVMVLFIMLSFQMELNAQVSINEYTCANLNTSIDNHSDYEDWIELYNAGSSPVDLANYYVSDDSLNANKFKIPAGVVIPANGYLTLWCSGRNEYASGFLHTNFKLTQTKNNPEHIMFSNPSGTLIDHIKVKKTKLGHSRGRSVNGGGVWVIYTTPTRGYNNSGATYTAYSNRPTFSINAGFFTSAQSISLINNEPTSTKMYYTLDGSAPSASSFLYMGPITITATTVVKAISVSNDPSILPGFIEYNTYFINEQHSLPVISISGSQLDVLANGNNALRPHGSLEYFTAAGIRTSSAYGEYNSHGQDSWANDQRSLDFVSRDEMGYTAELKEKLFPQSDRKSFQRFILRAAGDDNYPSSHRPDNEGCAHLRDAYFQNICQRGGLNLDTRTGTKCVVYLNGVYWGVYDLREIPDEHDYTDYYYGQDKYHLQYILTWGNTWAEYGGNQAITDWSNLRNYILTNNMADDAKFNYVDSLLDVYSLADYVISHSMSVSSDWLNYNTGWWRGTDTAGGHRKWGYILWDNDASFAFYINYTGIPDTSASASVCNVDNLYQDPMSDPEAHTRVLLKLRTNPKFDQWYVSRYADLMNTVFSCDNMLAYLDSTMQVIQPEMARHAQRWYGTYNEWYNNYLRLRDFVSRRCGATANTGMNDCYGLTGPYPITFTADPAAAANIQVNSLSITQLPWSAYYFGNLDVELEATPKDTNLYAFDHWEDFHHVFKFNDTLAANGISPFRSDTLTAIFKSKADLSENTFFENYMQVYPNPSAGAFTIAFEINQNMPVQIELYALNGKKAAVLMPHQNQLNAGNYTLDVDLSKNSFAPGIYFIHFIGGNYEQVLKYVYVGE